MSQFNILDNRPLETLDMIQDDIVMLARGPLMQGLLTDKYLEVLSKKHKGGVLGINKDELVNQLSTLQEKYDSLTELSYSFLKYHNAVIVNGVSSLEQLKENVTAFNNASSLDASEYDDLYKQLNILKYEEHRP